MLDVVSLGSGSSGNALLVCTAELVLLVDCGIDAGRLSADLFAQGIPLDRIDAILLSHEHTDHIQALPRIAQPGAVLLSTRGTARACDLRRSNWLETRPERPSIIADVEIVAIPVSHDAAEPCGFLLRTPAGTLTVLTDLGAPSAQAVEAIAASDLVVLEANYDDDMLRRGPYATRLKRRILYETGHRSNAGCGQLLAAALRESDRSPTLWLAHLSQTNNRPRLAKDAVERRLAGDGLRLPVLPLPRRGVGPAWRAAQARQRVTQLLLPMGAPDDTRAVDASRLY